MTTNLNIEDVKTLREAYAGICRARAAYAELMRNFGAVEPFAGLHGEAARQLAKIEALFERYGIALHAPPCAGSVKRFDTIPQAVHAAISAERRSAALMRASRVPVHGSDPFLRVERLCAAPDAAAESSPGGAGDTS